MGGQIAKLKAVNYDSLFSYETVKFVKIQDRRLGILHYSLQFAIFIYIVVYTIIIQKRYLLPELPAASIRATARQPPNITNAAYLPYCYQNQTTYVGFSNYNCTYLLGLDITYPPAQLESLVMATRIKDSYYRIPENCTSDVPTDIDCAPTLDSVNEFRYYVANIENFTVYMEHAIFARTVQITGTNRDGTGEMKFRDGSNRKIEFNDPTRAGDIVDVQSILEAANLPSLNELSGIGKNFRYDGVLIIVVVEYSNDVIHPSRIHYKYFCYHIPNVEVLSFGPSTVVQGARLQRNYYGIRLAFLIAGSVGKFDFPTLLTALVNGVVLVKLATVIVDVLLLFALPQKKLYMKHKFELTEEFAVAKARKKSLTQSSLPLSVNMDPLREREDGVIFKNSDNNESSDVIGSNPC